MDRNLCTLELRPAAQKITVHRDENLLDALTAHGILLRADCGGTGLCGQCTVDVIAEDGTATKVQACSFPVLEDMVLHIPPSSLLSQAIIDKAPIALPTSFTSRADQPDSVSAPGIAIDLGTTTIAIYLCERNTGRVVASLAMKNPQGLHGDDVMTRIGKISRNRQMLLQLQRSVVHAIDRGMQQLCVQANFNPESLTRTVVVGNPAMIHILLGVDPSPIGVAPYLPAFFRARRTKATSLGFTFSQLHIDTLAQVAGFLGGDILAATLATELAEAPVGTLLIDLGTNGELVLKGRDTLYVTSCATGPAFEGAALSCGMQATPGAINGVQLLHRQDAPRFSVIAADKSSPPAPSGLCGSGVISAVAALLRTGLIEPNGRFSRQQPCPRLQISDQQVWYYVLVTGEETATGREIVLSQKDIRAVQLGKAALITGIEFLLRAAGMTLPTKIIVAGAFGCYLDGGDMLALGMLPQIDPTLILAAGNAAGAGAIMALCDDHCRAKTTDLAARMTVIDLAADADFHSTFASHLHFPENQ